MVRLTLANHIKDKEVFVTKSAELMGLILEGAVKVRLGGLYNLSDVWGAKEELSQGKTAGQLLVKASASTDDWSIAFW